MIVMKFGGTSVADRAAIERVIAIVRAARQVAVQPESRDWRGPVVVVSALSGATDRLLGIAAQAGAGDIDGAQDHLRALCARHLDVAGIVTQPEEDHWVYRMANRLHRTTRDPVIDSILLVRPGDPYSRRLLEESERLLRATRYLYDAQIVPVAYRDNRVDLEVITRDVWTLTAGVGLSREGGENATSIQLQDTNFLGTGRDVELQHTTDVDRDTTELKYRDLAVLGSRASLEMWVAERSDGDLQRMELERPFFALDTRWGAGLFYRDEDRVDSLYEGGEVIDRFRQERLFFELYGGRSEGLAGFGGRAAGRWRAGFTYDRRQFGHRAVDSRLVAIEPAESDR